MATTNSAGLSIGLHSKEPESGASSGPRSARAEDHAILRFLIL